MRLRRSTRAAASALGLADDALGLGAGALEHGRGLGVGLGGLGLIFGLERLGLGAKLGGLVELVADRRRSSCRARAPISAGTRFQIRMAKTTTIASAIHCGASRPSAVGSSA